MKTTTIPQILIIDAAGQALGRVASQAAMHLRGKNSPSFRPHVLPETKVKIMNASKLKAETKKMTQTLKTRYTGYAGGLRQPSLAQVVEKHGWTEPLRLAIRGMLPANKLRDVIMRHLEITE